MVAYNTLRAAIDSYIKANGNKEITGTVLNDILNAMVSALGADTRFAGVAVPTTNPGNPEGNVVYFASQAGTYSNFGGIVLPLGIHILVWNGTAWTSQTWFSVDNTPTQNSQNLATSGGILQAIVDAVGVERLRAIGAEVTSCSFDDTTKKISFFNSADDTLFQLDATAFVIDGMVSDVKIEDGNLVIQFNTDAGKQDIEIPLTDIFNPANYYTKTAIDALLALYYTKTETDALLTAINNKLADGCFYRGMAEPTTNPPTPTTKVFYIATKAGTYTNFGNIAVTEGITILKYDGSNWSKEQISYSDGVFDISAYNGTSYADLSAALGINGANIPQNLRKGGMSIKFVQSSDNRYIQARCMAQNFTTDVTQWQGVDDEPTAGSDNLVESGGAFAMVGEKTSGVLPVEELLTFNGWLDSSNKIVSYGQAKFCVIRVKEGDVINKSSEALSFAMIVNSFDYVYTLPYTPDYATGESGRRGSLNYYIVPAGAKYLLLTVVDSSGNSVLPSTFTINGIDVLNTTLRDALSVNAAKIKDVYSVFNGIAESPVLYNGNIDGSNQIVDYQGSKYFAVKANGGQILYAENARLCIVKSFEPTHTLPYSIDFADGETAIRTGKVDITLPVDTEYVLVSYNYAGTNNYPSYLSLDGGPNLMLSLDENIEKVYKSIDDVSFDVRGIGSLTKHDGWIDSSNKIVNAYNAKYVVIKINGGDVITKHFVQYGNFFILSDYDVPQNLPYSVVFATGTTGLFNDVYKLTTPSDANYIALAVERNGVSLLPEKFEINGIDIANTINDKIRTIDNDFQQYSKITNYTRLNGYLDGTNTIVAWKQAKHIVVPVTNLRGAELFIASSAATSALAFVKSYTYNPVLPYTLDMSEEEANIINIPSDSLGGTMIIVPSDANYMILRANYKDGSDNLPNIVIVNNKYNLLQDFFNNTINDYKVPYVYSQNKNLKVVNVYNPSHIGNNGMCTIDGVLCSAYGSGIYIKGTSDTLIGSQLKDLGISVHSNDLDYCIYTDTLVTAVIPTVDGGVMQLCLLQDAYAKLYSNDELVEGDWLRIDMPSELDSDYIMVSNCFGESCYILYCILIDRAQNFTNKNKRLLKIQLEMGSDGISYTGNYTIIYNKPLPYITEIQGSKYCNGKLYVSTDNYLNTPQRHSSITVIDIETLDAVEHISYVNQAELSKSIEAEGVSFVDDKLYQITIIHIDSNTKIRQLRCFDRFCL